MMENITLKVAGKAIIINSEGKVLLLREASTYQEGTNTGRYQCPGGRLNAGENYTAGLLREVREEAGLDVEPLYPVYVGEWRPVIRNVPHQIIGIFTACRAKSTTVTLSEEHDAYLWVDPLALPEINITADDRAAIEQYGKRLFANTTHLNEATL